MQRAEKGHAVRRSACRGSGGQRRGATARTARPIRKEGIACVFKALLEQTSFLRLLRLCQEPWFWQSPRASVRRRKLQSCLASEFHQSSCSKDAGSARQCSTHGSACDATRAVSDATAPLPVDAAAAATTGDTTGDPCFQAPRKVKQSLWRFGTSTPVPGFSKSAARPPKLESDPPVSQGPCSFTTWAKVLDCSRFRRVVRSSERLAIRIKNEALREFRAPLGAVKLRVVAVEVTPSDRDRIHQTHPSRQLPSSKKRLRDGVLSMFGLYHYAPCLAG